MISVNNKYAITLISCVNEQRKETHKLFLKIKARVWFFSADLLMLIAIAQS